MKEPKNNAVVIDSDGDAWQRLDACETEDGRWFNTGNAHPATWAEIQTYRPFRAVIAVTS